MNINFFSKNDKFKIINYMKIQKKDIKSLDLCYKYIEEIMSKEEKNSNIYNFFVDKKNYLQKIESIYSIDLKTNLKNKKIITTKEKSNILLLTNYDLNTIIKNCNHGYFLIDALDPYNRKLYKYYKTWYFKYKNIYKYFFLWLEEQAILNIKKNYICNQKERKNYIIKIYKNNLVWFNKKNINDGKYMYIIGLDKSISINKSDEKNYNHASFNNYQPTLGAGNIIIDKNKISYIDNESGHYQPFPYDLQQTILIFIEKGLLSSDKLNINCLGINGIEKYTSINFFLQKKFYTNIDLIYRYKRYNNLIKFIF